MRPHPPPPARPSATRTLQRQHAARNLRLPRQHVAARSPDAHPRLPASQSPLRTTCLPAPASARDPTGSRAAVRCPHAPAWAKVGRPRDRTPARSLAGSLRGPPRGAARRL